MTPDAPGTPDATSLPATTQAPPPPEPAAALTPRTPFSWRLGIAAAILTIATSAYLLQPQIGTRGQALAGVFCFFGVVALFSTNLRLVNWRTIGWGIALQACLALLVLKAEWTVEKTVIDD